MSESARTESETDPRFPSGPWVGFFLQSVPAHGKHWMELQLTFAGGVLQGGGRDIIGPFSFYGKYDLTDGRCSWTKSYHGQHDVQYTGFNEGKGIWGQWEILPEPDTAVRLHGGFHIWPKAMGDPAGKSLTVAADLPREEVMEPLKIAEPVGGESQRAFLRSGSIRNRRSVAPIRRDSVGHDARAESHNSRGPGKRISGISSPCFFDSSSRVF